MFDNQEENPVILTLQWIKVNSKNYDIILVISTYYTEIYIIYKFMTS